MNDSNTIHPALVALPAHCREPRIACERPDTKCEALLRMLADGLDAEGIKPDVPSSSFNWLVLRENMAGEQREVHAEVRVADRLAANCVYGCVAGRVGERLASGVLDRIRPDALVSVKRRPHQIDCCRTPKFSGESGVFGR